MSERDFWLEMRRGLLQQVEAIERAHLPDKHEETQRAKRLLEQDYQRSHAVVSTQN